MTKKTKAIIIIAFISAIALTFGLTYAYFTWQSEETAVRITVDGVPISYNAGEDITGNLLPTLTKEEGISKDITVKLTKDNYESYIVYYLKIKYRRYIYIIFMDRWKYGKSIRNGKSNI